MLVRNSAELSPDMKTYTDCNLYIEVNRRSCGCRAISCLFCSIKNPGDLKRFVHVVHIVIKWLCVIDAFDFIIFTYNNTRTMLTKLTNVFKK